MANPLTRLHTDHDQSPWVDNLRRDDLTSGHIAELRDSGIRGMTSNPSIFEKAISDSTAYDEQFADLVAAGTDVRDSTIESYWSLVVDDIENACDLFADLHTESGGIDGYVSIEVAPNLAHDSARTEQAAREFHQRIDRPNLMVKIPATAAGIAPIHNMIAEGRNVNVTLIFGLQRYEEVIEAYISGLESFAADPDADLGTVASVASFFVSRVDVEVDRRLDEIGTAGIDQLKGRAAVAQAKLAYQLFRRKFSGDRWDALDARGARVQRPLWASTSTKNPDDPPTKYVDELIGPDTVTTLPEATIDAFNTTGTVARTVDDDVEFANEVWTELAAVGVDMDDVAERLETEGVESFTTSFDNLIDTLHDKATQLRRSRRRPGTHHVRRTIWKSRPSSGS